MGRLFALRDGWRSLVLLLATIPASSWGLVETTSESFVATATMIPGNGGAGMRVSFFAPRITTPAVYAGKVTSAPAGAVVDSTATWVQDQFNGTNGAHYLETAAGAIIDIIDTDPATKALTISPGMASLVTPGSNYRIRRHLTISDVFGKNNEAGLTPGQNGVQADNILLHDPQAQRTLTIFYSNIPGFSGWYFDPAYTSAADTVISPQSGLIVRIKSNRNTIVYVDGAARKQPTLAPVFGGFNLLGTVTSRRSLKLSELNLYSGNAATGIASGNNPAVADNLILINPDTSTATYFYSDFPGFEGWYNASFQSSADVLIQPGSAFFVQRKAPRGPFYWSIPAE